jgi:hypothetical protein
VPRATSSASPEPRDVIEMPDPCSIKRPILLAPFCLARGARGVLRQHGEPRGPSPRRPSPPMDRRDRAQWTGTAHWPNMTPVIPPRRRPYLYSDGGSCYCANRPPLYANPGARAAHPRRCERPQYEAWSRHVAPADGEVKSSRP